MRISAALLILASAATPVWADGLASSLRIDLSLYRVSSCLGDHPSITPPFARPHPVTPCISDRFAAVRDPDHWEARPTAWYSFSSSSRLGFGVDLATGNKHTTLKLRGRRIMFEYRF